MKVHRRVEGEEEGVREHPARDHEVVTEYKAGDGNDGEARDGGSSEYGPKSGDHRCLRAPPDGKLKHHQGETEEEDGDQVRDQERTTTVFAHDVGESPYIPDTYRRPDACYNEAKGR